MNKKIVIRYSEAFKIEVVKRYEETGMTQVEIKEMYGILGNQTISNWIRKYGKESSQNKILRVEKPGELDRLKALEKENDKLKKALADAHIKQITTESFVEAVGDLMGMSVEELKKKFGEKS